jgi:hypothetical protein
MGGSCESPRLSIRLVLRRVLLSIRTCIQDAPAVYDGNAVHSERVGPVASRFEPATHRLLACCVAYGNRKCLIKTHHGAFSQCSRDDVPGYHARLALGACGCWGDSHGAYGGRGHDDRGNEHLPIGAHKRLLLFFCINDDSFAIIRQVQ